MKITFAGQPFPDNERLYEFVTKALADDSIEQVVMAVAWVKRSGLLRLQEALEDFSAAGGHSMIIVGVDQRGTTDQGLRLAAELFDETYVFHEPGFRTFHPKIYFATGRGPSHLHVGSHNLTAGGVFFNYEAAVHIELDLANADDRAVHDDAQQYIERLIAQRQICLPHDDTLHRYLVDKKLIVDEDAKRRIPEAADAPEEADDEPSDEDEEEEASPFGRPEETMRSDPHPVRRGGAPVDQPRAPRQPARPPAPTPPPPSPTRQPGPTPPPAPSVHVIRRWTKRLAKSDAQQPTAGSNPTGNLRLTKAGHAINWRTFFRDQLFAPVNWHSTTDTAGNAIEVADVDFEVEFDGVAKGARTLRVDHAPHRESGQANHVTVLHWDDLITELQRQSFVGYYVVIERLSDDSYRLRIERADPGAIL
ncbi:MAG: hypothetical protein ACRDKJ_01400 [Actinomycetota bacterium]